MPHHLWHARRLFVVAQFLYPVEPQPQLVVPVCPWVTLDLFRSSPLEAERAHPVRFAVAREPDVRGSVVVTVHWEW